MIRSLLIADYFCYYWCHSRLCYLECVYCLEYVITLILYNQRHCMLLRTASHNICNPIYCIYIRDSIIVYSAIIAFDCYHIHIWFLTLCQYWHHSKDSCQGGISHRVRSHNRSNIEDIYRI